MKVLLFVFATTALFADYSKEALQRFKREVPMKAHACEPSCECCDSYTGPYVCCGCGFFLMGDYILWTARTSNSAFAVSNQHEIDVPSISSVKRGEVFHPNWGLKSGFRIGLGRYLGCDGWRLSARYTWLRFQHRKLKPKLKGDQTFLSSPVDPLIEIEAVKGKFQLDFNVLDVQVGRSFCIDSCLLIDGLFGLKFNWQNYRMLIKESGQSRSTLNPAVALKWFTNDVWGAGIRAGFAPRWYWSPYVSLYAELFASALWQQFDAKGKITSRDSTTRLVSSLLNIQDCFFLITPVLEAELGLRWEEWYFCNRYHFVVKAGWGIQWWGRQNQLLTSFADTRDGDLGLQGLTLSFEFDF